MTQSMQPWPLSEGEMLTQRDARALQAGHLLYNSGSGSYSATTHSSVSLDDVTTRDGKISAVRRTFCLIALFDLILSFILWIIYTQLNGLGSVWQALEAEVAKYDFHTSLFDTVMLALIRFVVIELAYALFRSTKPWMVALTTFATCVFLLVKVFLYDFPGKNKGSTGNAMDYVVLIVSFTMAWAETWFLDFKVLRQEKKAHDRLLAISNSEREPLLNGAPNLRYDTAEYYYSPIMSRGGSDDEASIDGDGHHRKTNKFHSPHSTKGNSTPASRASVNTTLGQQEQDFSEMAEKTVDSMWELYTVVDGWKLEASKNNATVHSKAVPKIGKIFRLEGIVDIAPQKIMEDLFYDVHNTPTWNPTVINAEILQTLDKQTDIVYSVAAEAAGGLVTARDFVQVRRWSIRDGVYFIASRSCEFEDKPPVKQYVRGENHPGGFLFVPDPEDPNRTNFVFILCSDLKGWIPQVVIDQALSGVLFEFLSHLRSYADSLNTNHNEQQQQQQQQNEYNTNEQLDNRPLANGDVYDNANYRKELYWDVNNQSPTPAAMFKDVRSDDDNYSNYSGNQQFHDPRETDQVL
ncbi:stAR-related lipid transfer protein 3-like isoform X2 [Tubulanus polymorphus]|uniref:stAR-related lipid transfer protein 3-like isoform X2 n=1 Tax=Tubulanus polymorphus TaxID=672921 RepID=UPI003DA25DA6